MEIILSCGSEVDDLNSQYGDNLSPGVEFRDVPAETGSLAVFMVDLDASEARKVHWVIWNIPPGKDLPVGVERGHRPGNVESCAQGNNDYDVMGYTGPEYPPGDETYRFTAYALKEMLDIREGSNREDVRQAMSGLVLDKATAEAGYTN